MIPKRHLRNVALLGAALVAIGAASYGVTLLAFGGTDATIEAQQPEEPTREELEKAYTELKDRFDEENSEPAFTGDLGNFVVTTEDPFDDLTELCVAGSIQSREDDFLPSELNFAEGMTSQTICDGEVIATFSFAVGARVHFTGQAPVSGRDASAERLQLTTVDDHSALIIIPPAGLGAHFIFVIDRPAEGGVEGIMFGGIGMTYDNALEAGRKGLTAE